MLSMRFLPVNLLAAMLSLCTFLANLLAARLSLFILTLAPGEVAIHLCLMASAHPLEILKACGLKTMTARRMQHQHFFSGPKS